MGAEQNNLINGSTATEIAASVERAIREGAMSPGTVLPSVRQLAASLQVSPSTAAASYRWLRERGLITTRERSRTRVSLRPPLPTRPTLPLPDHIRDLASGNPDPALLPPLEQVLRDLDVPTRLYGEPSAYPPLLDLAAAELSRLGLPSRHLAVTNGGLDAIERILGAHLNIGDRIAIEDPCYTGVLDLLRAMGFVPEPFLIDSAGPLPDSFERALSAGVSACIVTPRGQNPTGAALDEDRVAQLRTVLRRHPDLLVIEDDHAGLVVGTPPMTLIEDRQRWAWVQSISKSLGPDLRVAVVAADELTTARVEGRQLLGCGWVSHILQRLTAEVWARAEGSLEDASRRYAERRRALVDALSERRIAATGRSGFNVWVPTSAEEPVTRGLLQLGWAVKAGEPYRLHSEPGVRVTISTLTRDEAPRFATDLEQVLRPERTTHRP